MRLQAEYDLKKAAQRQEGDGSCRADRAGEAARTSPRLTLAQGRNCGWYVDVVPHWYELDEKIGGDLEKRGELLCLLLANGPLPAQGF